MTVWNVVQTAGPWLWMGMVFAISFLEAPLKFRAPGITVELGVGIGRLVFRALNRMELAFAVAIVRRPASRPAHSVTWFASHVEDGTPRGTNHPV